MHNSIEKVAVSLKQMIHVSKEILALLKDDVKFLSQKGYC